MWCRSASGIRWNKYEEIYKAKRCKLKIGPRPRHSYSKTANTLPRGSINPPHFSFILLQTVITTHIWKLSLRSRYAMQLYFYYTIRPTDHTNLSRKRSFAKTLLKRRNLKTPALRFSVDGRRFENGPFRKPWRHDNHMLSLHARVFFKHKSKLTGDCCVFRFLWRWWTETVWWVLRLKPSLSNFSGWMWIRP